jgi:hypothetical protein
VLPALPAARFAARRSRSSALRCCSRRICSSKVPSVESSLPSTCARRSAGVCAGAPVSAVPSRRLPSPSPAPLFVLPLLSPVEPLPPGRAEPSPRDEDGEVEGNDPGEVEGADGTEGAPPPGRPAPPPAPPPPGSPPGRLPGRPPAPPPPDVAHPASAAATAHTSNRDPRCITSDSPRPSRPGTREAGLPAGCRPYLQRAQ